MECLHNCTLEYSWKFLVGVFCLVLQILILFLTKKCHFSHPLNSDLATKKLMSSFIHVLRL